MSIAATYNTTRLASSAIYSLGSNKDFSYEDKNPVYVLLIELGLFITGTLLLMKEWINNKHFVIDLKDMKGKSKRFVVHI
jgi:hypothetical protein